MTTEHSVDTVVVGAGHAGLAVSRLLSSAGREHVVLERGRVGERWRSERWDSLHLLTPNWMTRLPGWYYSGPDPEGFQSAGTFARHLGRYAASFAAPVLTGTQVESLTSGPAGSYVLRTNHGTWRTRSVVIATGPHATPAIPPGLGARRPPHRHQRPLPQPRSAQPRRRPRRGRLLLRRTDRRRAGQVGSRGGARGRPAHPNATPVPRHGRVLVADRHRSARPHDRRSTGSRRLPPRAVTSADRSQRGERRRRRRRPGRLATSRRPAERSPPGPRRTPRDVRPAAGGRHRGRRPAPAAISRLSRPVRRSRRTDRRGAGRCAGPTPVPTVSAPPTSGSARRRHRDGRPRNRLPPRPRVGATSPSRPTDGSIRQYRGVTDAPGVYVVGQRFQHRRDSGFIDGARHDAHAVVAPPDHRNPAGNRTAWGSRPARRTHERVRRRRRRWPGRRCRDRDAAVPRRAARGALRAFTTGLRHRCRPMP